MPREIDGRILRQPDPAGREIEVVRERVGNHLRLLVNLLQHEVAMVALVDGEARGDRMHDRALDALSLVVENLHRAARDDRPVAVFEIGDRLGEGRERDRVGAQEHLALAMADRERAAAARGDQKIVLAGEEHGQRERAFQPLQRLGHRLDRLQAAVERHGDQMRDHLGVGLAGELSPGRGDLALQRLEILDDAVVDDGDALGRVRMRVRFRRRAMRRPARVADAGVAGERLGHEPRLEVDELSLGAAAGEAPVLERRDAGGIVAAIFKPLQRIHDQRRDRPMTQNADDAAHRLAPREFPPSFYGRRR